MCSNFQIVIDTHSLAQDDLGKDMNVVRTDRLNAIPAPTHTVEILIFINIAKHSNRIIYLWHECGCTAKRAGTSTYICTRWNGTECLNI